MARKVKEFEAFGIAYRIRQFSAIKGFSFIDSKGNDHPCSMLEEVEAWHVDAWKPLSNPANINLFVYDTTRIIPPLAVLRGLTSVVRDFNFGFTPNWKGVRVPGRFLDGNTSVKSANTSPVISSILEEGVATLKELEEYYSTEDAFKMFDVLTAKGVSQALANEAAINKAGRR